MICVSGCSLWTHRAHGRRARRSARFKCVENDLYADVEQRIGPRVRIFHRVKWHWAQQLETAEETRQREGRKTSSFLGVINKSRVEYSHWFRRAGAEVEE